MTDTATTPVSPNVTSAEIPHDTPQPDIPEEKKEDTASSTPPPPPAAPHQPRKARRRPRRRAGSDESDERGSATDSSASDVSDPDDSDAEAADEPLSSATSHPQDESAKADGPSAAEFSAGAQGREASGPKKGGKTIIGKDGKERHYTEEENRRFEERKAKMKEKQKARKAEAKEARRRGAEGDAKAQAVSDDQSRGLEGTTQDSSPSAPPTGPKRQTRLSQNTSQPPEDPKTGFRAGGFWTHDQRQHPDQAFGGRGGRGGFARGGIRGRGRGRGGFGFQPSFQDAVPRELVGETMEPKTERQQGGGKLAMDLVEEELQEARERNRLAKLASVEGEVEVRTTEKVPAEVASPADEAESPVTANAIHTGAADRTSRRWGHEAYEAMAAEPVRRDGPGAHRGLFPGRGRGPARGMTRGVAPSGGAMARQAMAGARHQHQFQQSFPLPASVAPAPTPAATETPAAVGPLPETSPDEPRANYEDLLDSASDAVTVKLPGQAQSTVVPMSKAPLPVSAPAQSAPSHTPDPSTPAFTPNPSSAAHTPSAEIPRVPSYPDMTPAAPMQYPIATGSDGSLSSSGHYAPPQLPTLPPGVGITPNGELYSLATGQPVVLDLGQGVAAPPYYPSERPYQAYYPDQVYHGAVPMQSSGMYYSPVPVMDGRDSPLSAGYVTSPQGGTGAGYFAPARQQSRVTIRSPNGTSAAEESAGFSTKTAALKAAAVAKQPQYAAVQSNGVPPEMYAAYYAQQGGHYNPYMNGDGQEVYYDQRVYQGGRGRGQRGYGGMYGY